jgi:Protein of unknown function (DUF2794)
LNPAAPRVKLHALKLRDWSWEARVSDSDPIRLHPRFGGLSPPAEPQQMSRTAPAATAFTRQELNAILTVYGRKVSAGEWRDYAIDFGRETACFSAYRRTSEVPLYRIEKTPKLARKQGAFCVIAASGHILKRGHDLSQVLTVFDRKMQLV